MSAILLNPAVDKALIDIVLQVYQAYQAARLRALQVGITQEAMDAALDAADAKFDKVYGDPLATELPPPPTWPIEPPVVVEPPPIWPVGPPVAPLPPNQFATLEEATALIRDPFTGVVKLSNGNYQLWPQGSTPPEGATVAWP